ncbi:doublecortin domain-containing protein 2-like isoform X1 [Stegostoma tigrinum]|uniref:doublecortin domain-containing protein 2-like isoform X1 n=1 Tax=Stegostoma tigrinum TaxID=3053191 RepID=UPI00202B062A|nr:doublecortin domain-containing protein 2-like isoform X1 [Stegostoma tigrinum]
MATTKPTFLAQPVVKCVRVYRNGDPFYAGRKFVINERQISTFEAFLKEVTNGLEAPFGAVRNIYTPQQGHRVFQLEELDTGKQYVAGGKERFKKLDYIQIGIKKKKPLPKDVQIKPVAHSRIIASARFRKPAQEPCIICVFSNGDFLSPATRLLIPKRILGQWEQVLSSINEKVNLRTGAVRKLHTLDGRSISDGTELENGGYYVAVGRDKFKKLPYGELIFSKPCRGRSNGSKAASLPPILGSKKSKEHADRQVRSTGTTGEVYPMTSPQPAKRKGKKEQVTTGGESVFHAKPIKVRNVKEDIGNSKLSQHDGCVFKAYEERTETMGATEVQEDNQTQVELPIDQRPAETVDEEEDLPELCNEQGSHEGREDSPNVEQETCNDAFNEENILKIAHVEDNLHRFDLPHREIKTSEKSETDQQEEEIAHLTEEEVKDQTEENQDDKYFNQNSLAHKEQMMSKESEIDQQEEEEIADLAEEEVEDQTEGNEEDKYFNPTNLPHKEQTPNKESEIDHQIEEEIADLSEEELEDQTEGNEEDESFNQNDFPHNEHSTGDESKIDHQIEEEIADLAEEEIEDIDQMEENGEDKSFYQSDFPRKEEILSEESEIDHHVTEDISDPTEEEEQDVDQMEGMHENKYFHHKQDEFQKEDLDQELEDNLADGETPLEEPDKEIEVITTEELGKDVDNLGEVLSSRAESIPSPLESDGNETIQPATGHAVLAQ